MNVAILKSDVLDKMTLDELQAEFVKLAVPLATLGDQRLAILNMIEARRIKARRGLNLEDATPLEIDAMRAALKELG